MPYYDLKCENCNYEYEGFASIYDDNKTVAKKNKCPKCNSVRVIKQLCTNPIYINGIQ